MQLGRSQPAAAEREKNYILIGDHLALHPASSDPSACYCPLMLSLSLYFSLSPSLSNLRLIHETLCPARLSLVAGEFKCHGVKITLMQS